MPAVDLRIHPATEPEAATPGVVVELTYDTAIESSREHLDAVQRSVRIALWGVGCHRTISR